MTKVPATEFKAKCLELMDRVSEHRESYVITKRGKPVARLVPADPPKRKSIFGCMADQTIVVADLERPAWTEEEWREFERQRAAQWKTWEREWQSHGTISGRKTVGPPPHIVEAKARPRRTSRGSTR